MSVSILPGSLQIVAVAAVVGKPCAEGLAVEVAWSLAQGEAVAVASKLVVAVGRLLALSAGQPEY